MKTYEDFLREKKTIAPMSGFKISDTEINNLLFPHQKDIVRWSVEGGRRAIFANYGLGKTFCQLEIMRIIGNHYPGKQLIIAPLGVRNEFKADAVKLNIEINFIRRTEELNGDGIYITNYESVRDGRLDVNEFNACSLDEASVLRSYGSLTYQNFLTLFGSIRFKFVATATPAPNRFKEMIHYAGFLGVMDTGAALTMFFKRDSTQANNLQIHPHKTKEFWLWVSSWALFLKKPSDLGYDDTGYDLPDLNIHYHEVESDSPPSQDRDGQMMIFSDASLSLQDAVCKDGGGVMVRHVYLCGCVRDPEEAVKSHKTGRMVCPEHETNIDYSIYTCEQCGKKDIGRFTNKRGPLCRDCKAEKTKEYSRAYSRQYNIQHTKPKKREKKDDTTGTISTDYGLKTGTKPDCGFYSLCLIDAAFSFEINVVIPCKKCKIYAPVRALKAEDYVRVSDICTSNVTELPISPEVRRIGRR